MTRYHLVLLVFTVLIILSSPVNSAVPDSFTTGPQLEGFGPNVLVEADVELREDQTFKVVFDVGEQGKTDAVNRNFNSLARFINLHVRAGVKPENIKLALVVHGKAVYEILNNDVYSKKFSSSNPNHALLNALLKNNVDIYLCGQTAGYYGVSNDDLHEGVQMSLSAMTAHALLQQQGYTLNPF